MRALLTAKEVEERNARMTNIAKQHLFFDTLETRNAGDLDFREVSVWGVKIALNSAYWAGYWAGRQSVNQKK